MPLSTSPEGRAALRLREGCRLAAYQDTAGVWTIGVGHTGRASGQPVLPGTTITQAEADALFAADLAPFEAAVNRSVTRPVTQGQFDALVSLAFNIGASAFAASSVVRRLEAGDLAGAADAFLMWDRPPALKRRRAAERAQFLAATKPATTSVPAVPPRAVATPEPTSPPPVPPLRWWDRLWIALTFRKATS